jgi:plasmid stabilization system protein ParE
MDAGSGTNGHQRLAVLSEAATLDLAEIHTHTNRRWGWEQAERYIRFIREEAQKVADGETLGKPIPRRPGRFYISETWHNARDGHRIVYEIVPEGISIVRILHTAMLMLKHVKRR